MGPEGVGANKFDFLAKGVIPCVFFCSSFLGKIERKKRYLSINQTSYSTINCMVSTIFSRFYREPKYPLKAQKTNDPHVDHYHIVTQGHCFSSSSSRRAPHVTAATAAAARRRTPTLAATCCRRCRAAAIPAALAAPPPFPSPPPLPRRPRRAASAVVVNWIEGSKGAIILEKDINVCSEPSTTDRVSK